jgi:carboxypeptidase family protein
MRRNILVGVLVAAVAVAAAVLWLSRRHPHADRAGNAATPAAAPPGSAPAAAPVRAAGGDKPAAPPREPPVAYEDDPAGKLRLEGQVVDEEERPVAGAAVTLSANPPRRIRSENDGSFTFDKLLPRSYAVTAHRQDAFAGPVVVRLTGKTEPVILRLKAVGGLEVTVVTLTGHQPIAGAHVELREEEDIAATTGAEGKATLRGLRAGWHVLTASAKGYAPAELPFETGGSGGTIDRQTLELKPGAAVAGRVVDRGGKPVAGAKVASADAAQLFSFAAAKSAVTSDKDGKFVIPALPAGTFRLTATHQSHAPATTPPLTLDGTNGRDDVTITMDDGGRIAGRVVDKGGAPVASATVRVVTPAEGMTAVWEGTRQAYADDQGRFEVTGLPRRKLDLVAQHETGSSPRVSVDLAARPAATDVTLTLEITGTIAGTVVTPGGEPIAGAQVMAMVDLTGKSEELANFRLRGPAFDTADGAGRFEIHGLPDGAYRLRASRAEASWDAMYLRPGILVHAGDQAVRLELASDGHVVGKVLFADGTAPDTYSVSASWGNGAPFAARDGSFTLDAPAGRITLTVSGPQFVRKSLSDVEIKGDATTDVGTINVEKGRSLSGRVLHPDGSPVAGAKVLGGPQLMGSGADLGAGLFSSGLGIKSTTSGDDGSWILAGVGPKVLVLAADHPTEGRSAMVRIPAGDQSTQVDLVLRPLGSLQGHVTAGGQPVASALVMANPQQAARGTFIVKAGDDGAYRFDKLAPDTYVVSAVRQAGLTGGDLHARVVTINVQETASLDIDLPVSGIDVTVQLKPPDGVAVANAQVFLLTGKVAAATADQMYEAFAVRGEGAGYQLLLFKGEPGKLERVPPGAYTACSIPFPGDINSIADMQKLRDKLDKLPVVCTAEAVAATPSAQTLVVPVPAAPVL